MEFKGIIFDYGGTLDTGGCHWGKMIWHAYERNNVPVSEGMFREAYVFAERKLGANFIIQPDHSFYKTLEIKLTLEFEYLSTKGFLSATGFSLVSMKNAVLTDLYENVKKHTAHSREVLLKLKEKYPLVLVSNFYGNISVVLNEFGFDNLFVGIVESAVVNVRKPDPAIFQLGVTALNMTPEDVVVVGDSYAKDIVPAHSIGCKTVWIQGEGWTNEVHPVSIADVIIQDIAQLLQVDK